METHNPLTAEGMLAAEAKNVLIKIDVYLVEQEQTQPYYTCLSTTVSCFTSTDSFYFAVFAQMVFCILKLKNRR